MPEKQRYDRALKVHPQLLNTILTKHPLEVPNPLIGTGTEFIDTAFYYDAVLLNDRLASIPIEDINPKDLRTVVGQVLDKQNEFAFGAGIEGAARQMLTSSKKLDAPFTSSMARFDNPGEIWVVTKTSGDVLNATTNEVTRQTAYGLVPLEQAYADVEFEQQRRVLNPVVKARDINKAYQGIKIKEGFRVTDNPATYDIEQALILPPAIADYTRALQIHAHRYLNTPENIDVTAFRKQYFGIDTDKPTEVLRAIKQEYLGNTTWGTILSAELLIRLVDYGIGHVPIAGPVWDFLQASTGKELPLPLMERIVRHALRDRNLPLPEGVFDKPSKGRWLELVDTFIGAVPHFFPPAILAKIPIGTILEVAIYADKMKNSAQYFTPFIEIAESTGTKPAVIDKVQRFSKMPSAVIKNALQRRKTK